MDFFVIYFYLSHDLKCYIFLFTWFSHRQTLIIEVKKQKRGYSGLLTRTWLTTCTSRNIFWSTKKQTFWVFSYFNAIICNVNTNMKSNIVILLLLEYYFRRNIQKDSRIIPLLKSLFLQHYPSIGKRKLKKHYKNVE